MGSDSADVRQYHGCRGDECDAAVLDGIICGDDICDIRAGLRPAPCDHPLRRAFDEIVMRQRFGTLYDEIFAESASAPEKRGRS